MSNIVTTENTIVVDVDNALDEWRAYQRLTNELLDDSDYHCHKGKKYKKKSAWQKYARAFNVNTEIVNKEIIRSKTNAVIEAEYTVRATLPNGRYVESDGSCDRREAGKSEMSSHSIKATAKTRATNRAISELIGAGDVSADELDPAFDNDFIEASYSNNSAFVPANNIEPIADDPVSRNWVKSFCKILKEQGKPCRKGTLLKCARKCDKLSSEEKEQVILYIKSLPNGEIELDD